MKIFDWLDLIKEAKRLRARMKKHRRELPYLDVFQIEDGNIIYTDGLIVIKRQVHTTKENGIYNLDTLEKVDNYFPDWRGAIPDQCMNIIALTGNKKYDYDVLCENDIIIDRFYWNEIFNVLPEDKLRCFYSKVDKPVLFTKSMPYDKTLILSNNFVLVMPVRRNDN